MDIFKELEKIYNELVILDFALKYLKILIDSTDCADNTDKNNIPRVIKIFPTKRKKLYLKTQTIEEKIKEKKMYEKYCEELNELYRYLEYVKEEYQKRKEEYGVYEQVTEIEQETESDEEEDEI